MEYSQFYYNRAVGIGDNNAGGYGGAFYSKVIDLNMIECEFEGNFVNAGGLFTEYSSNGGAVYVSSSKVSNIQNSVFFANHADQGTAGGFYCTDTEKMRLINNTFTANFAKSSYVHKAEGGAIAASHKSYVEIIGCTFLRNRAEPLFTLVPLTYSGNGGAIFIQSASVNISGCFFTSNHASTGQFDSGASGGAVSLIDSLNSHITNSIFRLNSARGYSGVYSYSSSGTGGAVSILFSTTLISSCDFDYNWVSAGGTEYSLGGAISIFYENSDAEAVPIKIKDSKFSGNIATGEICTTTVVYKAGEGGAISVFGTEDLGVDLENILFRENVADTQSTLRTTSSFGGAMMISQSSSVRCKNCSFTNNVAHNGYAADISSVTDAEDSKVYLNLTDCSFKAATSIGDIIERVLSKIPDLSCNDEDASSYYVESFDQTIYSARSRRLQMRASHDHVVIQAKNPLRSSRVAAHRRLMNPNVQNPSVILGAGKTVFINPEFIGSYTIFAGNILTAILESDDVDIGFVIQDCFVYILGNLNGLDLNLIAMKSALVIENYDPSHTTEITVASLILFNSSLAINHNINVSDFGVLMGAYVQSTHVDNNFVPTISYFGTLHSGFFDMTSVADSFEPISKIEAALFSPNTTLNGCSVNVHRVFILASTRTPGKNETKLPPVNFFIMNKGSLTFFEDATVYVKANIFIYENSSFTNCGFKNYGTLILGYPAASEESTVTVFGGCFSQSATGTLTVTLDDTPISAPLFATTTNATILGNLNITLLGGSDTKLSLYGPLPTSTWKIFEFEKVGRNILGSLYIQAPPGLGFYLDVEMSGSFSAPEVLDSITSRIRRYGATLLSLRGSVTDQEVDFPRSKDVFTSAAESWVGYDEYLVLSEMSCSSVSRYYDFNVSDVCSVCLKNSSCGYCSGSNSCVKQGSCSSGFENYDGNCCPEMCNGHGDCNSDLECECNFLYTGSSNCKEFSVFFYIIISGCVFIVCFALLSLRYYISYRRQKKSVLEKLRKRLLSAEGDDTKEGGFVTNLFLKNLQQDLILRDVFVNNDEIKLEEKIGEGSFGVVFKATFRGAQVAVKQMRSPVFMQLTENDIEEFRKEAYMMSRLRHPNIVLVMGVSVVEQEPVAPPVMRGKMIDEDLLSDMKSRDSKDGKPSKPVKSICIITEYLEQGSLADILYGPNKIAPEMWSYELALACALQAARGMLYLHSHSPPICHRDLKSSNLVVDDHWVVKVTDFGMSRMVPEKLQDIEIGLIADDSGNNDGTQEDERNSFEGSGRPSLDSARESAVGDVRQSFNPMMTSNLGTTAWCAPELLTSSNKTRYSVKVDVYSFGLVLWELWERKRPYDDLYSRFDIIDAIRAGRRPPISPSCPPALRSLIQRCWHGQPARRPTFSYIVRYLKDELARIKRQRLASSSSMSSGGISMRWVTGGYTPPTMPPSSVGESSAPTMNALHNVSSDQETNINGSTSSSWRRFLDNSVDEVGTSPAATGGKSWVVHDFRRTSSSGTGASPASDSPHGPVGKGTWRDRYVMKFSGWQASRPDTGLPPSVSGPAPQGARRQSSQSVPIPPPPTRASAPAQADSDVPAGSASSSISTAFSSMRNIIIGSPSTGGSQDRSRDSNRDSKDANRRRSISQHSERSIERERERDWEREQRNSAGVSLQNLDHTTLDAVVEVSGSSNGDSTRTESTIDHLAEARSRVRSLSM